MDFSPHVTVLMPSFNEPVEFISETIESVLNQTFTDFEFIIVDDSTNEETINCINNYSKKDNRIRIIREDHVKGVSGARNLGIKAAKGDFIVNIDADDVCFPDRIENQLKGFSSDDIVAVGGNVLVINEKNVITRRPEPIDPDWNIISRHLQYGIVDMSQPSSMVRKSTLLEVGGYDELMKCSEDFDLWYKIAINHKWTIVPDLVIKYRVHGNNAHLRLQELQARLCCVVLIKYAFRLDRCLNNNEYDALVSETQSSLICRLYVYVRCTKSRILSTLFGTLRLNELFAKRIIEHYSKSEFSKILKAT